MSAGDILWDGEDCSDLDNLAEGLEGLRAIVTAVAEWANENPPHDLAVAQVALVSEWSEIKCDLGVIDERLTGLCHCVNWAPGHAFHADFAPVTPIYRKLRSGIEASFARVLELLSRSEGAAKKLENAARLFEAGRAVLQADGKIVDLGDGSLAT